ncbi:unnamed protein product [Musa textilis]
MEESVEHKRRRGGEEGFPEISSPAAKRLRDELLLDDDDAGAGEQDLVSVMKTLEEEISLPSPLPPQSQAAVWIDQPVWGTSARPPMTSLAYRRRLRFRHRPRAARPPSWKPPLSPTKEVRRRLWGSVTCGDWTTSSATTGGPRRCSGSGRRGGGWRSRRTGCCSTAGCSNTMTPLTARQPTSRISPGGPTRCPPSDRCGTHPAFLH